MSRLPTRADGRLVVPGNRFDLLPAGPAPDAEVSVVVPWFRDQAGLDLVLAGLAAQTHPAARLQVVVADDGSPQPPRVPPGVTVVRQERAGFRAAAARNLGVRATEGEVVCFLDADTVPEPGYVAAAAGHTARCPDVLTVGRRRHADLAGWTPERLREWFAGGDGPAELAEPGWLHEGYRDTAHLLDVDDRSYRYVISAVLTASREMLDAVGGFDETFTAYGGEDWDLAHRAFTAGAVLCHRRDAVAWHDGPDWSARLEPAAARAQKNAELRTLAARIPDPGLRGDGSWPVAPALLVHFPADAADDAWWLSARAWLAAAADISLVTGDRLRAGLDDSRVLTPAAAAAAAARARVVVQVREPQLPGRGFVAGLCGGLAAGSGVGRLDARDGSLTAWASRARNRVQRHGTPLAALFDTATVDPPPRVEDTPANLGRWLPRLPLP